jgi:hypothetical protein
MSVAPEKNNIVVSDHARSQSLRRCVSLELLIQVVRAPEQRLVVRPGREIRQSRIAIPEGGTLYLVRAVVDIAPSEETVVTVYRTSKIHKYWSKT